MSEARVEMRSRHVWRIIRSLSPKGPEDLLRRSIETRWMRLHYSDDDPWGIGPWFRDRMGFAYGALLLPWRWFRAGKRPLDAKVLVADRMARSDYRRAARAYLVEHAFGDKAQVFFYDDAFPAVARPRTAAAMLLWVRAVGWWLGSLVDFSPARYRWLGFSVAMAMDFEVVRQSCERLYVFGVANPIHYLAAAYAYEALGMDVRIADSGSPLYRSMRVIHLDCPLVLCSRIQEHELAYYAAQGLNRAHGLYAGNENALDLVGREPAPLRYDIGYYSSGMWAREGGLLQTADVESIRRGVYQDNPYAARGLQIIETMARFARQQGRTLKIYPHPYERRLLKEHGIEPPYMGLVDDESVFFGAEGESSRALMGEPFVAVSLQSTLIFERLDAGFEHSYVYLWGDPERDVLDLAAAGPFGAKCFRSMDELCAILERDLDGQAPLR